MGVCAGVIGDEFGFAPGVGTEFGNTVGAGVEKATGAPVAYCGAGVEFGFVLGKWSPRRLFDVPDVPNGLFTVFDVVLRRQNILLYLY